MKLFLITAAASICCALCVGCGNSEPVATGTVTFDGQPVQSGMIMMIPVDDKKMTPSSGKITDGKFKFSVKPGKKRVEIHAFRAGPIDPMMKSPIQVEYIPEIYNSKSTLVKEITPAGENQFVFDLTSDSKSK